jgi:glucosylceramidase
MKQNNNIRIEYVDAWVDYMVKYLSAFKAGGVQVDAMTMQNEPLHSSDSAWTTYMDQSYQGIIANRLGPAIQRAGHTTKLWAYDHNTDVAGYPAFVLANASAYVKTVAWHCYAGGGQEKWKVLSTFHDQHPNVQQYMTECWTHVPNEGFWELPDFVTGPIQNYASGALAWTLGGSTRFDVSWPGGCRSVQWFDSGRQNGCEV